MNSTYRDESFWKNANHFDAFRFESLRDQAPDLAEGNKWQFVASNNQSYSFGYGQHAGPGRHLAAMELKVILANLLMKYDLQSDSLMEYKTGIRGFMFLPDVEKMTLKVRSGGEGENGRRDSGTTLIGI